ELGHFEPNFTLHHSLPAVLDYLRTELARVFGNRRRLHYALGADAERIHLPALHVADDEELDDLIEVVLAGVDLYVIFRAERPRAFREHFRGIRVDAARIDRHGDDGTPVGGAEPRHEKRRVEAARKREQNGIVAWRKRVGHEFRR